MSFNIIQIYEIEKYTNNFHELNYDLNTLVKNLYPSGNINFADNDKIVFYQRDLDFFISKDFPGLAVYNLQLILKKIGISNFFCILISSIPNIQKYLDLANNILTPTDVPIKGITSFYRICQHMNNLALSTSQYDHIEYPFIVLSRQRRVHRIFFMSKLFNKKLQNIGLIGYHNIPYANTPSTTVDQRKTNLSFLTPNIFTYSFEINLLQKDNQIIFNNFDAEVKSYHNFTENLDYSDKIKCIEFNSNIILSSFLYIGLETTVNLPEPFLTNISFRGIVYRRPFVILGDVGTLKLLRSLGFKTFSSFWDESYDEENDFESRVDLILGIIESLSNKSMIELNALIENMQSILEFNYNHLQTFKANESLKIQSYLL